MYEQIETSKENESRAVANNVAQKKSDRKLGVSFVDIAISDQSRYIY